MIKGSWWPMLNGRTILYGEKNPISITSPFELKNILGSYTQSVEEFREYHLYAKSSKVYSIDQVIITKIETNLPILCINALGSVISTGWNNARLSQDNNIITSKDEILEFSFVADEPTGIVNPIISPVSATMFMPFHNWKSVKIIAATNSKTIELGKPLELFDSGHFIITPINRKSD